jgi:hypothetical protein
MCPLPSSEICHIATHPLPGQACNNPTPCTQLSPTPEKRPGRAGCTRSGLQHPARPSIPPNCFKLPHLDKPPAHQYPKPLHIGQTHQCQSNSTSSVAAGSGMLTLLLQTQCSADQGHTGCRDLCTSRHRRQQYPSKQADKERNCFTLEAVHEQEGEATRLHTFTPRHTECAGWHKKACNQYPVDTSAILSSPHLHTQGKFLIWDKRVPRHLCQHTQRRHLTCGTRERPTTAKLGAGMPVRHSLCIRGMAVHLLVDLT